MMIRFRCPTALNFDYHAEASLRFSEEQEKYPIYVRLLPFVDDIDDEVQPGETSAFVPKTETKADWIDDWIEDATNEDIKQIYVTNKVEATTSTAPDSSDNHSLFLTFVQCSILRMTTTKRIASEPWRDSLRQDSRSPAPVKLPFLQQVFQSRSFPLSKIHGWLPPSCIVDRYFSKRKIDAFLQGGRFAFYSIKVRGALCRAIVPFEVEPPHSQKPMSILEAAAQVAMIALSLGFGQQQQTPIDTTEDTTCQPREPPAKRQKLNKTISFASSIQDENNHCAQQEHPDPSEPPALHNHQVRAPCTIEELFALQACRRKQRRLNKLRKRAKKEKRKRTEDDGLACKKYKPDHNQTCLRLAQGLDHDSILETNHLARKAITTEKLAPRRQPGNTDGEALGKTSSPRSAEILRTLGIPSKQALVAISDSTFQQARKLLDRHPAPQKDRHPAPLTTMRLGRIKVAQGGAAILGPKQPQEAKTVFSKDSFAEKLRDKINGRNQQANNDEWIATEAQGKRPGDPCPPSRAQGGEKPVAIPPQHAPLTSDFSISTPNGKGRGYDQQRGASLHESVLQRKQTQRTSYPSIGTTLIDVKGNCAAVNYMTGDCLQPSTLSQAGSLKATTNRLGRIESQVTTPERPSSHGIIRSTALEGVKSCNSHRHTIKSKLIAPDSRKALPNENNSENTEARSRENQRRKFQPTQPTPTHELVISQSDFVQRALTKNCAFSTPNAKFVLKSAPVTSSHERKCHDDTSKVIDVGQRTQTNLLLEVPCSENFLDTWPDLFAELASGQWAMRGACDEDEGLGQTDLLPKTSDKRIVLVDTHLLDQCGVDIELPNRGALITYTVSALEVESDAKSIVLGLASLAATNRYRRLYVVLCYDVELTELSRQRIIQLQTAVLCSSTQTVTPTFFKISSTLSLATCIAQTIMSASCKSNGSEDTVDSSVIDKMKDPIISEQAWMLLSLAPRLTARGAVSCLEYAQKLTNNLDPFPILLQDSRLQQVTMIGARSSSSKVPEVPEDAMLQLRHSLQAPLFKNNGTHI